MDLVGQRLVLELGIFMGVGPIPLWSLGTTPRHRLVLATGLRVVARVGLLATESTLLGLGTAAPGKLVYEGWLELSGRIRCVQRRL